MELQGTDIAALLLLAFAVVLTVYAHFQERHFQQVIQSQKAALAPDLPARSSAGPSVHPAE